MEKKFAPTESLYTQIIHEEAKNGGFDLIDQVDVELYNTLPFHSIARLRKGSKHISLYRTDAILEWLKDHDTHPETRAKLSVAPRRIFAKQHWSKLFSTIKLQHVTPLFKQQALIEYINTPANFINKERARAFVDLSTLHELGFIHNLDFTETVAVFAVQEKPCALFRTSSLHGTKEEEQCVVFVFAFGWKNDPCVQIRLLYMPGSGVYIMRGSRIPSDLSEQNMTEYFVHTSFLSLVDAIECVLAYRGCGWNDMLIENRSVQENKSTEQ